MPPELRPYQLRTIDSARAARRQGHRRILLALPTGAGKSIIAVEMVRSAVEAFGARALIIGHRKELLDQFYVHMGRCGIVPGVLRGSDTRTNPDAPVQVATIQTMVRRELPPADLVFVDEAHRAPGESYARILGQYPKATVIGLTATPCRLDGRPLKEHFDVLIEGARYSELIDAGAIVAPVLYVPPKGQPDLSKVRTVAGDYHEGDLESVMLQPHVIGDVVKEWQEKSGGRKTVVFAVGVEHSRELCERFLEAGVRARHLDGQTPEQERDQTLMDLETGKIQVVCNVGILCEGWDQPSVKCAVMARPTKSLTLWMQCAGRILRPHGDQAPVILDHSGNVERHGMPHEDRTWSLDGAAKRTRVVKGRVCPKCYAYVESNPCPVCGHELVGGGAPRKVRTADGVLERIDANIAKEKSSDPKRAFFDAQVEIARKRGYSPGYASVKYKEKFDGAWPSWAWSQSVKADFARDPEWQHRCEIAKAKRKFWEERNAEPEHAPAIESHESEEYADDIPF